MCASERVCMYVCICTAWLVQILNECLGMDHPYSGQTQFNGFCFCEKMRVWVHYISEHKMRDSKEANTENVC